MRIRLNDIGQDGLSVTETIPLAEVNERVRGDEVGIVFTESPRVELHVSMMGNDGRARGTIETGYTQSCGRCLVPVPRRVEIPVELLLKKRTGRQAEHTAAGEIDTEEDQDGIVYFSDDHIDLDDTLHELIILSLNIHWLPDRKEDGSCSACGITCDDMLKATDSGDHETRAGGKGSLGMLLEKAAEHAGKRKKRG